MTPGVRRLALAMVATWLGCGPPPRPDETPSRATVVAGAIDAAQILAPAVVAAEAAGAVDFVPLGARAMVEGEQLGSFVALPADQCLLALGRGGATVRDVDLFVYDDAGDRLGADESPNAGAATVVCPPHPERVYVAARLVTGDGILAVGIMTVPVTAADAVAQAVEARGRPGTDTGELASWPGLERKIRERRESLGGRWEDLRRVAIPLHSRAEAAVSFPVQAHRCVDLMVAPGDEVHGLEATVTDPDGRVLARGRPPGRDRTFVICSQVDRELVLTVRPRHSTGLAAVIISRSPEGSASTIASRLDVFGVTSLHPLDEAEERLARRLSSLSLQGRVVARGEATVGLQRGIDLDLPAGCVRIDVVGGSPLGGFTASLWTAKGRHLAEAAGGPSAALFTCGPGQKARLEVRADEQAGPYAVRLAHDPRPAPPLTSHPRAAAALAAWLEAAGGPIDFEAIAPSEVIPLPADQRVERRVTVPADGCRDFVAAVSPPSAGLSYRLIDGNDVIGGGRGERVVGDRICDIGRELVVELELATGGEALWLSRER